MLNSAIMFIPRLLPGPQVFYGKGSLVFLKHLPAQKIALISSRSAKQTPAHAKISEFLQGKIACETECASAGQEEVERIAKFLSENPHDTVIAFGGGKVMDCAKLATFLAEQNATLKELNMLCDLKRKSTFVAIPTTPATGSEANGVAVMLSKEGKKTAFSSSSLVPDYTVLDPETLSTLPKQTLLESAGDIFGHAAESSLSRFSTPLIKAVAKSSVELLSEALPAIEAATAGPADSAALEKLFYAGYLAGFCAGNAFVGPVHALAHTAEELGKVPHSRGVLNITGPYLEWMCQKNPSPECDWFSKKHKELGLQKLCSNGVFQKLDSGAWADAALLDTSMRTGKARFDKNSLCGLIECIKTQ
ncbi:MAG: iron-containing alcohol dehydrogenase [Candidatus Micrarchaeia archaeon]|jgi:alcohol dehydrogenase class IV